MTPTTQKAYSIQRQLLNSLLIGLPIIWLSITLISVWRLSHEINEINDTQITQLARYLIGISQDVKLHLANPANAPKILNLENIKNIVLFPPSWNKIKPLLDKTFNIIETSSMQEAVNFAFKLTKNWKICLLSTASPSYSIWKNFEEKWDLFYKEILKYIKK